MITAETLASHAYDQFEADTSRLHALIRAGRVNSPEADDVRGALADVWHDLTPDQRRFGNAFSGDLYMFDPDVGETFEPATDDERSPRQLGAGLQLARDRQDWSAALGLLRKGPPFLTPEQVAYLRAVAYGHLGRPSAALAFIRHARRLDPADRLYSTLELEWMFADPAQVGEATSLAWRYAADVTEAAPLVLTAAGLLMSATIGGNDLATVTAVASRLIPILRDVVGRLSSVRGDKADDWLTVARVRLAICLEATDPSAARTVYQSVIDSSARDLDGVIARAQVREYVRQRFARGVDAPANLPPFAAERLTQILVPFGAAASRRV